MTTEKHDGILDFYRGRINSAPSYGFTSGHELLMVIIRTAFNDSMLTPSEFDTIINLCQQAHIKMMEDNYNAEW